MAREFKLFDVRFAKLAGTALKTIEAKGGKIPREDITACDHWPHPFLEKFTEAYSKNQVAYAVYTTPDADEWQRFRVSLKGLNTYEKLYALAWYWDYNQGTSQVIVRVNNYLGALKRSGHLNQELRVVKA